MKILIKLLALLCFLPLTISCGGSSSSWLFPLWVETDIVATDLDGDQRIDVVTLARLSTNNSTHEGRLTVYRQTAPGVFMKESYLVGVYPWKVTVSDLDQDGRPDLLVTDPDQRVVWLLRQNREEPGSFLAPQQIADNILVYEATTADFNGDGAADIAIADNLKGNNRLMLLYQNPALPGTFGPTVNLPLPGNPLNLATGDLNGDGRADLWAWIYLAGNDYTPNGILGILLQRTDGTFDTVTTLSPQSGLNVGLLATFDYNGDNRHDLLTYFTPSSSEETAKISVLLQEGSSANFSPPLETLLSGIQGLNGATVADLNNDGRPDVALAGFFPVGSPSRIKSRLNLLTQSGSGAFSLAVTYDDLPITVSRVAAGDLDNDEREDLILLGDENQCLVMTQRTVPGSFNPPYPLQ